MPEPQVHPTETLNATSQTGSFVESSSGVQLASQPFPHIAGYEIIELLGRGGMGVVYKARHSGLKRIVALKMVRSGFGAADQDLARFRTEAEAIARLQHPHIVQVYEFGEHEGQPYFSLEFAGGGNLKNYLAGVPLPPREAALLAELLARAVFAAHERGIIHRDLKPANILLSGDPWPPENERPTTDKLIPKITDFGLAKRLDEDSGQTQTGQILGTPSYMAPEQAGGRMSEVGTATDVYALGAILYEMLTGRPPFRGASVRETLEQVCNQEPVAPRLLNNRIPRDLETICLKAMAKEPGRRYASARELADDLQRFQKGESIHARPVGRIESAVRWARRKPMQATAVMLSVLLVAALTAAGVALAYSGKLEQAFKGEVKAREEEEKHRKIAETALREADLARRAEAIERGRAEAALVLADDLAYVHNLFLAEIALKENNVFRALDRLQSCKPALRNWEWHYLHNQCHGELFAETGGLAVFSPDGLKILLSAEPGRGDNIVRIYDLKTGRESLAIKGPKPLFHTAFSPDGNRIVVGPHPQSGDGIVRVFDARNGNELFSLPSKAKLLAALYSPDGSRLFGIPDIDQSDDVLRVYDAQSGKETYTVSGFSPFNPPIFSADGRRFAKPPHPIPKINEGVISIHDAQSGRETMVLKATVKLANPVFSPDGSQVAADSAHRTGGDGAVRLFDVTTGRVVQVFKAPTILSYPAFSPDGKRILATGRDGLARFFDIKSGQETLAFKGPTGANANRELSPDGTRVAVLTDGLIQIIDATNGQASLPLRAPTRLELPVFSPDGSMLSARGSDGVVRVFDVRLGQQSGPRRSSFVVNGITHSYPRFSPDGQLITAARFTKLTIDNVRTGQPAFSVNGGFRHSPVFAPNGELVAAASDNGTVRVFELSSKREICALKAESRLDLPVFSPDSSRIVVASDPVGGDGIIRIYDARTGAELGSIKAPVKLKDPAVSPNGVSIAAVAADGTVRLYRASDAHELFVLKGPKAFASAVFSPDTSKVAVSPDAKLGDGVVRVYDAETGSELASFTAPGGGLRNPLFSPDSKRLVVSSSLDGDGRVRFFDLATGREGPILKAESRLDAAAFNRDGTRLAVFQWDRSLKFYDSRSGHEMFDFAMPVQTLHRNLPMVFSPDGTSVAAEAKGSDGMFVWQAFQNLDDLRAARRERLFAR